MQSPPATCDKMTQPHASLEPLAKREEAEDTSTVTQENKKGEDRESELLQAQEQSKQQEKSHFEGTLIKTIYGIAPRQIAFAPSGEIVLCEWDSTCVIVFSSSFRYFRSFAIGNIELPLERMLNSPKGVAVSSDNTVFVTAKHNVKKYTLEGQFIGSVGSEGSGRLQFNALSAIAYNGTNNRVYVCDGLNHRITILNHDLTFHGSFERKRSEAEQFLFINGISVDRKGNVLVSYSHNYGIQVFDASGNYLSSITHTTPEQQIWEPAGMCVGPDNRLYVVENKSDRVSIFDESGKYIKSFGKTGQHGERNDPYSEIFSADSYVHISNRGKLGEFNDPYGIAVNDGHLYVCDTDNTRIQIFK